MSIAGRQYPVGFYQGRSDSPPESQFTVIVSSLFMCDTSKAPFQKKKKMGSAKMIGTW